MKANKKFLIVGGIVLLLVIGGVVGALSFNKGGDKTEPESEEGYVEEAKNEYDKAKEANVKDADDLMNVEIDFDGGKSGCVRTDLDPGDECGLSHITEYRRG